MKTFSTTPKSEERVKSIPCPLCNHGEYRELWVLENFSISKCPKCSLVYQNPQPEVEDITNRYDNSYLDYEIENEDAFLNLMLLGLDDIGFNPELIDNENKTVLDIGCATGLFLDYMKKKGWRTVGVEVCSGAAEYGNSHRGVNIFNGVLEEAPIALNSIDVIHLSHVIEHINDPDKFVKKIYSILKPGGVVLCTTPNISGFQAKLFKDKWRSVIPDHLVLFSIKTLKRIFESNNFKVLNYKTWGGLCANSGYPNILKKVLDKLSKPLGFGDVVIIKAQKPL